MAGMRIGYAISNPTLIKYLNDAKYSFNSYTMNQTAIACGVEAVKDKAYFETQVQKIIDTREWTKEELRKLGFEFPDSKSNFIFVKHSKISVKNLFEALKKENIYVRFLGGARIQEYLRISIGTREEMETLISFLKDYLEKYENIFDQRVYNTEIQAYAKQMFFASQAMKQDASESPVGQKFVYDM